MVSKKPTKGRGGKKPAKSKVSISKLSNKRLNKLAKQGKLKGRVHNRNYVRQLKERIQGKVSPEEAELQREIEKQQKPDIPLSEADYEYFATPDRDFSFITNVEEVKETPSKKKQKKIEEYESQYEKSKKKNKTPTEIKPMLPIKTKAGIVPQSIRVERNQDEEEEEEGEDDEETAPTRVPQKPLPVLSAAQLIRQRGEKLAELKYKIGILASSIVENPEENTRKLRELREMLDNQDPDVFLTVKKIAIVSLTEVFKDIIPDYRIRLATEKEKTQSVKRDTKKLRDFEEVLLNNYKLFLEFLEVLIKAKAPKGNMHKKIRKKLTGALVPPEALQPLRSLALRCLCEILSTHPHFNYRTNVIALVVPYMNNKDQEISDLVCRYMRRIFKDDRSGDITLEIVRFIGRVTKACKFNVQPKILATLLSLKIKEVDRTPQDNKKTRKANMATMSRKDRKRKKQLQYLEKELEEVAASDNTQRRLRLNTEIISVIFLTYFRILKMGTNSNLLAVVLEGLAKFAHLINVEFFDDLFAVMNELVDSGDLTYRESLHCVQTAFKILSGQGSSLNIDPMRFYRHLYSCLLDLNAGVSSEDLPIALQCLDIMISRRKRQISQQRLLAFTKRLTTIALQTWSNGSIGALHTARAFIHADQKMDLLYDTDTLGNGLFSPELDDPEHANAGNTALYELHLLRRSYHPTVRQFATHLLCKAPLQGVGQLPVEISRKLPVELHADFDPSNMTFIPPVPSKPATKKWPPRRADFIQQEVRDKAQDVVSAFDLDQEPSSTNTETEQELGTANGDHDIPVQKPTKRKINGAVHGSIGKKQKQR